jgi:N-acetylmuramoyl-L-alanine amidase
MPSILVETGFISNPEECRKLIESRVPAGTGAQGIVDGIKRYIDEVTPTALRQVNSGPS